MPPMEEKLLFRVPEVAEQLQVSSATVYNLIKEGKLQALHIGRSLRVSPKALAEFMHETGAAD